MKKLKLFVWNDFCPDYSEGLAFAIAENLEEAMKMIEKEYKGNPYHWGLVGEYPLNTKIAFCVSGGS